MCNRYGVERLRRFAVHRGYGLEGARPDLLDDPRVRVVPFCPEDAGIGTPRGMPDIYDGHGFDVLDGRARVRDEHGTDLTEGMLRGAQAMLVHAREHDIDFAILTDGSAACGTQVITLGCRYDFHGRGKYAPYSIALDAHCASSLNGLLKPTRRTIYVFKDF